MSKQARKVFTAQTDADVVDQLRFTVAGLQAQGKPITVAGAAAEAFAAWVKLQEIEHNDGQPFPAAKVRAGRPLPEHTERES